MATAAADALNDRYYTSPLSRVFDASSTVAECMDAVLCVIASVGHAVSSAFRGLGKDSPAGSSQIADKANTGRSMISLVRTFQSIEALFTLKWLFKRDETGAATGKLRHPLTVATLLSLIAGRILGFVNNLHNMAAYNLGKHAKHIGHAITVCYTALVTFGFIDAIRSYANAQPGNSSDETVGLIQNTAYLVMHPFECGFGMGTKAAPALGIAGAVISGLGAIVIIATNIWQFSGFEVEKPA